MERAISGGCRFRELGCKSLKDIRPVGARCCAAAPADRIFSEKITLEGVPAGKAAKLIPGKLDISLPLPIEDCIVEASEIKGGTSPAYLAYALPAAAYDGAAEAILNEVGITPEALVPPASAVWDFLQSPPSGANSGNRARIHVSASARQWFIAAGSRSLEHVVSTPVGNLQALSRNVAIISMRLENPLITVSGSCATDELVAALSGTGASTSVVDSPIDFLARALARYGSRTRSGNIANFNRGDRAHPAAAGAACARASFTALALILLGAAFAAQQFTAYNKAKAREAAAEERLMAVANRLAGREIYADPLVAIELARNEFERNLNPEITAFTRKDATGALAAAVDSAASNGFSYSRIAVDGSELILESARPASQIPVRELGAALAHAGFRMETIPGPAFKARAIQNDGGANE